MPFEKIVCSHVVGYVLCAIASVLLKKIVSSRSSVALLLEAIRLEEIVEWRAEGRGSCSGEHSCPKTQCQFGDKFKRCLNGRFTGMHDPVEDGWIDMSCGNNCT
jgi:hypothetical protein